MFYWPETRDPVAHISRTADGRFVLVSTASSESSSDDGGFLARRPAFRASSPASGPPAWAPSFTFSDLSSVRHPSSAEKSTLLRSVHERYSQELPSLRAIHEESWQHQPPLFLPVDPWGLGQGVTRVDQPLFIPVDRLYLPVDPLATSSPPRVRLSSPRARHAGRQARSAPELAGDLLETSPSSSSGFGSKNTSQQNQSSQSGSVSVPPYRPPPPVTLLAHWLQDASVDASVDAHYEFDSVTPTRLDESHGTSDSEIYSPVFYPLAKQTKRLGAKYDNIEARVQAMKQEFNEFRKRQAKRRQSDELESAC